MRLLREHPMSANDFTARFGPWALVAGASEGLGLAYAEALAQRGMHLLLLARRGDALEQVATRLRAEYRIEVATVVVDLAAPDLATQLPNYLSDRDIGLLVYDAARTHIAPFETADLAHHLGIVDVNCRGPLTLCHALIPALRARGRGGIVLMSSMSSLQGSGLIASYAASKAFNSVLAESLWEELRTDGVAVMACLAGAIDTPSYRHNTPEHKQKRAMPMAPAAVAEDTLRALAAGRGPLFIPGRMNRLVAAIMRCFGSRARTRFFSRMTRDLYGG